MGHAVKGRSENAAATKRCPLTPWRRKCFHPNIFWWLRRRTGRWCGQTANTRWSTNKAFTDRVPEGERREDVADSLARASGEFAGGQGRISKGSVPEPKNAHDGTASASPLATLLARLKNEARSASATSWSSPGSFRPPAGQRKFFSRRGFDATHSVTRSDRLKLSLLTVSGHSGASLYGRSLSQFCVLVQSLLAVLRSLLILTVGRRE